MGRGYKPASVAYPDPEPAGSGPFMPDPDLPDPEFSSPYLLACLKKNRYISAIFIAKVSFFVNN
jgi:hypothetical protein